MAYDGSFPRPVAELHFENFSIQEEPRSGDKFENEHGAIINPIKRGSPGDAALTAFVNRSTAEIRRAKRRSQFYGQVLALRETPSTSRDRIIKDSMITAEVKTNVIIQDEYTFITLFATHLSTRYARPLTSIAVHVSHSACLLMSGSFEPAYTLTITALPSAVLPVSNKRNAKLISEFLAENLSVPLSRGIIYFVPMPEEALAFNGTTLMGEIEEAAKSGAAAGRRDSATSMEEAPPSVTSGTAAMADLGRNWSRRTAQTQDRIARQHTRGHRQRSTVEHVRPGLLKPSPPPPPVQFAHEMPEKQQHRKLGKRRSLMIMFGK